jgi:hypothetical protein
MKDDQGNQSLGATNYEVVAIHAGMMVIDLVGAI